MTAAHIPETEVSLYLADPSLPALTFTVRGILTDADRDWIAARYASRRPAALRRRALLGARKALDRVTVHGCQVMTHSPGIDPDDILTPRRVE